MRLFSTYSWHCTLRICNYHPISRVFNQILFTDVGMFGCGIIIIILIIIWGVLSLFLCITTLLRTFFPLKLDAVSQLAAVPNTPLSPNLSLCLSVCNFLFLLLPVALSGTLAFIGFGSWGVRPINHIAYLFFFLSLSFFIYLPFISCTSVIIRNWASSVHCSVKCH